MHIPQKTKTEGKAGKGFTTSVFCFKSIFEVMQNGVRMNLLELAVTR